MFKLTIKIPERRHWRVFIINFKHISYPALVFLLLTLNMQLPAKYSRPFPKTFSLRHIKFTNSGN